MRDIYTTLTNTSIVACPMHKHLAEENGWSHLECGLYDEEMEDWPCYFSEVDTFWHDVNGQHYRSRDFSAKLQAEATTMERYREIVKRTYGNLRGVKFGIEAGGINDDHDPERPARMVARNLLTQNAANDGCCCMVGYNGCCGVCHNSCPCCEGVGQLDYGFGPTCPTCKGTGEWKAA